MSFDAGYRRWRASAEHAALIGVGYPETIQPFSFVPYDALTELAATLAIRPGQTLVDLGCGRGGIGRYVAERLGAGLVGVDSSSVAVKDARERSGRERSTEFIVADVAATGLASGCADALISIDVLQLVADPKLVIREIARVLRPGGRLALTTWEGRDGAPARFLREIGDALRQSRFDDIEVEDHPDWLERQLAIYAAAREHRVADEAVADLAAEADSWAGLNSLVRRVSVTARRSTLLAQCWHGEMTTLYIREVPEAVTETLKQRAALRGQSLSAYVATELTKLASCPTNEEVAARLQAKERHDGPTRREIVEAVETGRR